MMTRKSYLGVLLVPTLLLLIPLAAKRFTEGMLWSGFDFALAWIFMVGVGLAYKLVMNAAGGRIYRLAAGVALGAAFLLVWVNLAAGVIGSENNPANLLYGGVLVVALAGVALARFAASRMAWALWATALAQFLVPVVALLAWKPEFDFGVMKGFVVNFVFVLLFVASALLFRLAGSNQGGGGVQATA